MAQRKQAEQERERREREERQRDLLQRQRRILQANLRSQQRERTERDREDLREGLVRAEQLCEECCVEMSSSLQDLVSPPLLTVTSPYSTTPQVPPLPPHSSPPLRPALNNSSSFSSSSPHSVSLSPHTYTISSNHRPPIKTRVDHSGTSPPYHAEPLPANGDQQTSRESRILALTQSALDLKKRIAAEAERLKKTHSGPPSHTNITTGPSPPRRPPADISDVPLPPPMSLPGVQSVHRHALLAEEARKRGEEEARRRRMRGEAATTIQAGFRGHQVRRRLGWLLPSGHTLSASLGLGRVGDGEEDTDTGGNGVLKTVTQCQSVAVQTALDTPTTPRDPVAPPTSMEQQVRPHSHVIVYVCLHSEKSH